MTTVLIVDDEEDLRDILVIECRKAGYRPIEAATGNEAWRILCSEPVDAVILDLRMPDGDGLELLSRVRSREAEGPPVLLISGFSDATSDEARRLGAAALIHKPFERQEVMVALRDALAATCGDLRRNE